jgi:hypothetical protein
MDISTQIKDSLILRIKNSDNLNFLKALQTIFDTSEESLYDLNDDQKKSIEISRNQIKNGQFHTSDAVISEMREWLSKK